MSIQNEINRIAGAKTTLGNYLQQNGVAVPQDATLDTMALLLADVIEKQNKITASGILQGDGDGNISAAETVEGTASAVPSGLLKGSNGSIVSAVAGTDYLKTAPVTSVNGKTGAVTLDIPNLFIVDIALPFSSEDSYGEYTDEAVADKTAQEILDAYNNGDQVVAHVHYNDGVGYFAYLAYEPDTSSAEFGATWADNIMSPGALVTVNARVNTPPTSSEAIITKSGWLPDVTTSDNGKFLRVVNGAWAAASISNANGGSF